MIETYAAFRRCLVGLNYREPGEPLPEAHLWTMTESLLEHHEIQKARMSEVDFAAAVAKYCPGDAERIYTLLGLTPLELPNAEHTGPGRAPRTVLTSSKPTPIKPVQTKPAEIKPITDG
jgi:hypothetical protein